ncbi:DUF1015 domain-containing protein [Treponema sp.]|uniref:DUF1015 domain-containing protein n=1 Tax=Treponema sp. TaxID=166 RepID=UPI00298EB342|nr:DUF1015 domain-containing protein [Treponema sp.]MCR5614111.1 DUF1015 domain-containing protein [Treponema sp.]
MKNFNSYGIAIPQILLPKNIDTKTWSVVACDQYTQDRDYWTQVEKNASGKPSTLNIILPEVYLNDSDKEERIKKIKAVMSEYIKGGIFDEAQSEFIYIERTTAYGRVRHGLMACIDLDSYEWKPFSKALIRATEATILERIPPRMEIRRGAPIESPHIMLLVNDPDRSLVEATGDSVKKAGIKPCYSGELMQKSGSITGWPVKDESLLNQISAFLEKIARENTSEDGSTFMFAVGDGNHSLATAKAIWDEVKLNNGGQKLDDGTVTVPQGFENHNARFALIEIVNIFDTGLTFEPIHRVLFNIKPDSLIEKIKSELGGSISEISSKDELASKVKKSTASFGFVFKEGAAQKYVLLETPVKELAVARIQPVIDEYLKECGAAKDQIDYIHGTDEVFRLGASDDTVSLLLPPVAKDSFFATINGRGPLPRKSFSMGEADEKRFYLECRKLFS